PSVFFPAEVGIREDLVTGFKTFALPILARPRARLRPPDRERNARRGAVRPRRDRGLPRDHGWLRLSSSSNASKRATGPSRRCTRSEERRGGKARRRWTRARFYKADVREH